MVEGYACCGIKNVGLLGRGDMKEFHPFLELYFTYVFVVVLALYISFVFHIFQIKYLNFLT